MSDYMTETTKQTFADSVPCGRFCFSITSAAGDFIHRESLTCPLCSATVEVCKHSISGTLVERSPLVSTECLLCDALCGWSDISLWRHAVKESPLIQRWLDEQFSCKSTDVASEWEPFNSFFHQVYILHGFVFAHPYHETDPAFPTFSSTNFDQFSAWLCAVLETVRNDDLGKSVVKHTLLEYVHRERVAELRAAVSEIERKYASHVRGYVKLEKKIEEARAMGNSAHFERTVAKFDRFKSQYATIVDPWLAAKRALSDFEMQHGIRQAIEVAENERGELRSQMMDHGFTLETRVFEVVRDSLPTASDFDASRYDYVLVFSFDLVRMSCANGIVCGLGARAKAEFDYMVLRRERGLSAWHVWLIYEVKSSCGAIPFDSHKLNNALDILTQSPSFAGQRLKLAEAFWLPNSCGTQVSFDGDPFRLFRDAVSRKEHIRYVTDHPWGRSQVGIGGGDRRRLMHTMWSDVRIALFFPDILPFDEALYPVDPFSHLSASERVAARRAFIEELFMALPKMIALPEHERWAIVRDLHAHGGIVYFEHFFMAWLLMGQEEPEST